ncbi:glycoside hydrolase [Paenibacillus mucilaginosus 3016]|uniref:Glycoside hydrolase n=1 Tax=Paenibacillus mucilaginosus 3016 TaxID=1116391 RepID=H6NET0_9BACL|nr:glycoside hydrolase [Paenibacillus mucilaginosus 3016]
MCLLGDGESQQDVNGLRGDARLIRKKVGGTSHKPANSNVDVSLIYGDYYYVEALAKLMGWNSKVY